MPETLQTEITEAITMMGGDALYQCMQCGLCAGICPWPNVGSDFRAREVIHRTQLGLSGFEDPDILFACTTCKLCQVNCPRGVKIIDVMRATRAVMAESGFSPDSQKPIITSLQDNGNPWSEPREKRLKWAEGLEVPQFGPDTEYFFSVCCTSAYDTRSKKIAQALVKIFNAVGLSYGVIGEAESCCGESLRKMGAEEQFQTIAGKNIEMWAEHGVKKIIVTSPHCLGTYSQEYPELGGEVEVIHYSQLLAQLIAEGKLKLSGSLAKKVIYHDPCYLGRHCEVFEEPRQALAAVSEVEPLEFDDNRKLALCCGGGGGRLWMETENEQRFSTHKIREAAAKGAEVVATCCPYCISMLTDSAKVEGVDDKLEVMDLAEIIAQAL